ncbi:hypothetical protein BGW39_001622 [Mortierella sp. 14UC]|nr:hypothetical protein BGW39_001622 [Mortierella sp. 14UC]
MQSTTSESPMQFLFKGTIMQPITSEATFPSAIPPEVLERIALFTDPHTLTICIRACRLWFDCFLPALYQDINVYHFDYLSTDLGDGYPSRSDNIPRTKDTVGYGGQFIHKHGRFIKSVTVGTARALKYLLHPDCTNLEYVTTRAPLVKLYWSVRGMPADYSQYRAMPRNDAELSAFANKFSGENGNRLTSQIWVPLFTQHPGLRQISMYTLPAYDKDAVRVAKAMGALTKLKELHIKFVKHWEALQALLDFCPQVHKITMETFSNKYSNPIQTFRSRSNNYTEMTNEPKTQVRELDLFSRGRLQLQPWIIHVLWRCPLLESLVVPMYHNENNFPLVVRALVEHCPEIRHLYVRIQGMSKGPATVNALADLFNTGCPRLTSLKLYDAADVFLLEHHFANQDLRRRLEKFVYISSGPLSKRNDGAIAGSELAFGVLLVCPNLRVFEARRMTLDVFEFLEMDVVCLRTLTTLCLRLRYERTLSSEVVGEAAQQAAVEEQEKEDKNGSKDSEDRKGGERIVEGENNKKKKEQESIGENETQKEEKKDRAYYCPSLQSRVIAKLVQFTELKELRLGSDPENDRFREKGVSMLQLEMGEEELQRFAQMRRLEKLEVDGVNYSRRVRRMRWS